MFKSLIEGLRALGEGLSTFNFYGNSAGGYSSMNKVSINGVVITSTRSISVSNGLIIVDGNDLTDQVGVTDTTRKITVEVLSGSIDRLSADGDITVSGNVSGSINAGMDATVTGTVGGNVTAGMDVVCGAVDGNVTAGMGVTIRK